MARQIERSRSRSPIVRKAGAALVVVVAAYLVLHIIAGLLAAVFGVVAVIAVIVAVIWAAKELL